MKPFLSIVIPAYNEEHRLPKTLRDIHDVMRSAPYEYEILVVSDGSKDTTAALARSLTAEVKNLSVIENKENHGKGWVTRQGMLAAHGEFRLFMDADNSTTMREFSKLSPFLSSEGGSASGGKEGYDVVIGSRGVKGAELHPAQPWYRKIPGKVGNIIIQILVLWGIQDTQCGFKCFSAAAAEKIFPLMKIDRWGFDVEALALAKKFGFRVREVPILWMNDVNSTVGAGAYISVLIEVVKIKSWLLTGVYGKK